LCTIIIQKGFEKGKSIFDAVRTIDDILELAETTNRSSILIAIDFEKAFDSLDHSFLWFSGHFSFSSGEV